MIHGRAGGTEDEVRSQKRPGRSSRDVVHEEGEQVERRAVTVKVERTRVGSQF